MSNGQDQEQARRALQAIQQLRQQGVESGFLTTLEQRLSRRIGQGPDVQPAQLIDGETPLPQGVRMGLGLVRTAIGATETVGRFIGEIAERLPPVERLFGIRAEEPVEAPKEIPPLREFKRQIDEMAGFDQAFRAGTDVAGEILGLGIVGWAGGALTARAIGMSSFSLLGMRLERLTGLVSSAVAGGISEPVREAPIPEQPELLDPMGTIALKLKEAGVPDEEALVVGGAIVGGALGAIFDVVGAYRLRKGSSMEQVLEATRRERATRSVLERYSPGRPVERVSIADFVRRLNQDLMNQPPDLIIPDAVSKKLAEQMTRESIILSRTDLGQFDEITDGSFVEALTRGNPDGIVVAKGVDAAEAEEAIRTLRRVGGNFEVGRIKNPDGTWDYLVSSRPAKLVFSKVKKGSLGSEVFEFTIESGDQKLPGGGFWDPETKVITIQGVGDIASFTTKGVLGHSGVRDLFAQLVKRFPEAEIIQGLRVSGMRFGGVKPPHILVQDHFPNATLQQQANIVDAMGEVAGAGVKPETIEETLGIIRSRARGEIPPLTRGFGEDARELIRNQVGRVEAGIPLSGDVARIRVTESLRKRPTTPELTPQKRAQYAKEGAFEGQAVLTKKGTPLEYVRKLETDDVIARDPITGSKRVLKPGSFKILPYTYGPNLNRADDAVLSVLNRSERNAFVSLQRRAAALGAEPTPNAIRDLEELAANTDGVWLRQASKGEIQIIDLKSDDIVRFDNPNAAKEWLLNYSPMPPELTPEQLRNIEDLRFFFIGGNGPPIKPGEIMPMPEDAFQRSFKGTGIAENFLKPSRGLMLDLQNRTGVPVWTEGFEPLQRGERIGRNFEFRWLRSGKKIPEGVMPLNKIAKLAGKDSDPHLITAWLESETDAVKRAAIEAEMSPRSIRAAKELRKWYEALFKEFGIDPRMWLTDYAPHIREQATNYSTSLRNMWRETRRGSPIPAEVEFFAEGYRYGTLDLYETNAFRAAGRYLRGGANKLFINEAWENAYNLVREVGDRSITQPLSYYLEAIRGVEFGEQTTMMQNTFRRVMEKLPGNKVPGAELAAVADDYALTLLGLSYQATMAWRPGLATRNLTQTIQTTWTLFGTQPGRFMRALKVALTPAGRDAAIEAGAIGQRSIPVFAGEEFLDRMPSFIQRMSEAGLKMYTGADELNRVIAFWMGKLSAEDAIRNFARTTGGSTNTRVLARAKERLMKDARLIVYDQPVIDEFFRRLQRSPTDASNWIGKQAADVTQFLYGRGNQPRWMRSVFGRFFGQFGTWPLWYIDFVKRTSRNLLRNAGTAEMLKFWGRLSIANGAVVAAGAEVLDLDLSRWAAYNSVFYTGGPGLEFLIGLNRAVSGLGDSLQLNDTESFGRRRLLEGLSTMQRVGLAFIPSFYAVRDASRVVEAVEDGTLTELTSALLGVRPTSRYLQHREADAIEIFLEGESGAEEPGIRTPLDAIREQVATPSVSQ